MNRTALLTMSLFLLTFISIAHADHFQFLYSSGDATYYVSYSNIRAFDANNKWVFNGYTDYYGRIIINLSNGYYTGRVYYLNRWWNVWLVIDGSKELKRIYLQ